MIQTIANTLETLQKGKLDISYEAVQAMNQIAVTAINTDEWDKNILEDIYGVLLISNILYNNTQMGMMPLEDGVYDLLVAKYNKYTGGQSPVGATPIIFDNDNPNEVGIVDPNDMKEQRQLITICRKVDRSKTMFFNNIVRNSTPMEAFYDHSPIEYNAQDVKGYRNTKHKYPELVGTLDKCKFVLSKDATVRGIGNDPSIQIFERDFLGKYYVAGFRFNQLITELKYDGVSVEAEVNGDTIISARSRGDTANDKAEDLSFIFAGYKFPKAVGKVQPGTVFGMKFECIITKENLYAIKRDFGKVFKNARVAVIGIFHSLDARKYLPYLTLVPLRTAGLNMPNRQTEVEFLNTYYSSGVDLKYAILNGDYMQLLYQVDRFVKDAEYMRPYMNFMYDGVVVSFTDPNIINMLGRKNSVDQWSIAIKFNAMVKETIFYGYYFTVGQNGMITPIATFKPVEFLGTIHDKQSVHSRKKFDELGLRVGDIIRVEYRNDVITYIYKSDSIYNDYNPNPIIRFPKTCPCCGARLTLSKSSSFCPNPLCPEKVVGRSTNMLAKLGFKDFSQASIISLNIKSFTDLMNYDEADAINILGEVLGMKFMQRIEEFKNSKHYDYEVVGAIGFTSIASSKWKEILRNVSIRNIISLDGKELFNRLTSIPGIADKTASTIIVERDLFKNDMMTIMDMHNIIKTFGSKKDNRTQVRFTGFRDPDLSAAFEEIGFDADMTKSITKTTAILLVPYEGFTSSKTTKIKNINPDAVIMSPEEAKEFIDGVKENPNLFNMLQQ